MTEYDFSPEAYQRHIENMHRVARWVDYTEQHRTQFTDAAALITPPEVASSHGLENSTRLPPPLDLQHGHGMHYYLPTPPSAPSEEFTYATTARCPGPMPTSMYQHQVTVPSPGYGHGTQSSWNALPHDYHPQSPMFSHRYGSPPFLEYPVMPPYAIVSLGKSSMRKKSSSRRRGS